MSERKPQDVIERCAGIVHRAVQEHGTADEKWHCGIVLKELHRARESEEDKDAQIKALADALEGLGEHLPHGWHILRGELGCSAQCQKAAAALRAVGRLR